MTGIPHSKKHLLALLLIVATAATVAAAADPYLILERLLDRERIPRLLSTVDFGLSSVQPEQLEPVEGDFNGDRKKDMAIAGVYTLPGKNKAGEYFLLVVSDAEGKQPEKAQLRESRTPFYLHKPGTTGASDPGDQAFSFSPCINCSTGTDVRWNPDKRMFTDTAWLPGARIPVPMKTATAVDPKVADAALRIAGRLSDVHTFVESVARRGGDLVTRVDPIEGKPSTRVIVKIFERTVVGEELYDSIEVDTKAKRVVGRAGPGSAQ